MYIYIYYIYIYIYISSFLLMSVSISIFLIYSFCKFISYIYISCLPQKCPSASAICPGIYMYTHL